jgi:hypothetical protein
MSNFNQLIFVGPPVRRIIPKYDLKNQYRYKDEVAIVDKRENNLNRIIKLARLTTGRCTAARHTTATGQ